MLPILNQSAKESADTTKNFILRVEKEIKEYVKYRIKSEIEYKEYRAKHQLKMKSSIQSLKERGLNFQQIDRLRVSYEKIYNEEIEHMEQSEIIENVTSYISNHFKTNSRYSYLIKGYVENSKYVETYLMDFYQFSKDLKAFKEAQKVELKRLLDAALYDVVEVSTLMKGVIKSIYESVKLSISLDMGYDMCYSNSNTLISANRISGEIMKELEDVGDFRQADTEIVITETALEERYSFDIKLNFNTEESVYLLKHFRENNLPYICATENGIQYLLCYKRYLPDTYKHLGNSND